MTKGIVSFVLDDLNKIRRLVSIIEDSEFTREIRVLSFSTIGQHVRHILEIYLAILNGRTGEICYDKRKRDVLVQTNRNKACESIDYLTASLMRWKTDGAAILKANYQVDAIEELLFSTSLYRELAYALEHSVHHQAIIKIGLMELGLNIKEIASLGVAAATSRYKG
jgi:hypothetical protein